jgi:anhydro-N-acetylmuramic acid kinase
MGWRSAGVATAATGDTHINNGGCVAAAYMANLRESLAGTRVARGDEVGLSVDFKEAEAFALFGLWRLLGLRNTEPRATGALRGVIAGELSLPPGDD